MELNKEVTTVSNIKGIVVEFEELGGIGQFIVQYPNLRVPYDYPSFRQCYYVGEEYNLPQYLND